MQLTLRQSQILKDLKFPLLWMPIITFVAGIIVYLLYPSSKYYIEQELILVVFF